MKSFIVPVAIIIGLIIYFVIVDRKDFMRDNDVQSFQSGTAEGTLAGTAVSVSVTRNSMDAQPETAALQTVDKTANNAEFRTDGKTVANGLVKTNRLEQDAGMTLAIKDRHEDKQSEAFAMPVETRGVNSEKNNLEQAQPAEQ